MSTRFYRSPDGTGPCERSALSGSLRRGSTIRVVAFRASHPAKPPSRQRRLVQGYLKQLGPSLNSGHTCYFLIHPGCLNKI